MVGVLEVTMRRAPLPRGLWALLAAALGCACTGGSNGGGSSTASGPAAGDKAVTAPSAEPAQGSESMPDAKELASRLSATDGPSAAFVSAPEARLTAYPTPFFSTGVVVRVQRNLPTHPALLFVGSSPELVVTLTGKPSAFPQLAAKAGLSLDSADKRNGYVRAYYETTRIMSKRFDVLDKIEDLKPRPNLPPAEQTRLAEIQKTHGPAVKPVAMSDAPPYKGSLFAVKDQALVRYDVTLQPSGELEAKEITLEPNLPIPIAR
jgi:hypothetical protein